MSDKNKKSESQLQAEALELQNPYGKVTFIIPGKRSVSDKWGRVSCKMLDARVPIKALGLSIVCAIYANVERKGDGVSVVPSAYVPKQFSPDVEGAADVLAAHIETAVQLWPGYDDAYTATAALLMGHAEPSAAVNLPKIARPVLARLVGADGRVVATADASKVAQNSAAS